MRIDELGLKISGFFGGQPGGSEMDLRVEGFVL